ncbi:MAG: anthranilate phosphoribosyltransferase [Rikenellaceae bacterium]
MKKILTRLFEYESLTSDEARILLHGIAKGEYNSSQITGLMAVYLMRNISLEELSGFRNALLELKTEVDLSDFNTIDIVGTGGDGKDTFNISTTASFVVAGAGQKVVKHGNYSATSVSGASNVIENHGTRFTTDNDTLRRSLEESNFAYLHAPLFNSAMKAVASMRKEIGVRTFFNILGPLINPLQPKNQLLGVYNLSMLRMYSYMLQQMGVNYAVVNSLDGYDEISLTSQFKVSTSDRERIYSPSELQFPLYKESDIYGGATQKEAMQIFDNILNNCSTQAQKDCTVANAAFALNLMEREKSIEECVEMCRESIESGKALASFRKFVEINS